MPSPAQDAIKASAGGLFALCALYPLDLLRTKRAAESSTSNENSKKKSIWQEFAFMMREKGISELYRGLYLRAVHCVFSDLIYYGTFSMLQNRKEGRTPFENGTLAGIITNVLTIPVDTVSTNLQILESENRMGTVEVTRKIYREHGILKFWHGLAPACVLTLNPAINVAVFEQIKSSVLLKKQRRHLTNDFVQLSVFEAFVIGMISKAASTILTYPMIRVKTLLLKASEEDKVEQKNLAKNETPPEMRGTLSSVAKVIRIVLDHEGVTGFYRGMYVQLLRGSAGSGLMFMVREALT